MEGQAISQTGLALEPVSSSQRLAGSVCCGALSSPSFRTHTLTAPLQGVPARGQRSTCLTRVSLAAPPPPQQCLSPSSNHPSWLPLDRIPPGKTVSSYALTSGAAPLTVPSAVGCSRVLHLSTSAVAYVQSQRLVGRGLLGQSQQKRPGGCGWAQERKKPQAHKSLQHRLL